MDEIKKIVEEFEENGFIYTKETITNATTGEIISKAITLKNGNEINDIRPSEQDVVNAEILLSNAEILSKLNEQDEVQAEILLNQMEG